MLGQWNSEIEATKKKTEEVVKKEVGRVELILTEAHETEKHARQQQSGALDDEIDDRS